MADQVPTLNVDLLDRTLAYIEAHPETWVQEEWRCETGMCFAGWAVTLAGRKWASDDYSRFLSIYVEDSEWRRVAWDVAMSELGLSELEAGVLFHHLNTLDEIRRIVAEIKARAGVA